MVNNLERSTVYSMTYVMYVMVLTKIPNNGGKTLRKGLEG